MGVTESLMPNAEWQVEEPCPEKKTPTWKQAATGESSALARSKFLLFSIILAQWCEKGATEMKKNSNFDIFKGLFFSLSDFRQQQIVLHPRRKSAFLPGGGRSVPSPRVKNWWFGIISGVGVGGKRGTLTSKCVKFPFHAPSPVRRRNQSSVQIRRRKKWGANQKNRHKDL